MLQDEQMGPAVPTTIVASPRPLLYQAGISVMGFFFVVPSIANISAAARSETDGTNSRNYDGEKWCLRGPVWAPGSWQICKGRCTVKSS
jgi:hypothetical protein